MGMMKARIRKYRCITSITSSAQGPFGGWGSWVSCPAHYYLYQFQLKVESACGGDCDDTAANGVNMACHGPRHGVTKCNGCLRVLVWL